jgi:starch phosphorylase
VSEARTTEHLVVPAHQRLKELAGNLWWSWDDESFSLFRELDPLMWRELDHNPVALLQLLEMRALDDRASQLAMHGRINHAYRRMQGVSAVQEDMGCPARERAGRTDGGLLLRRVRSP